jgi:hypothetical protein
MPTFRMPSFPAVAGAFLGTAAGTVLFMLAIDRLNDATQAHRPPAGLAPPPRSEAERILAERAAEARRERDEYRVQVHHRDNDILRLTHEAERERERATVAESRLANCEQRLATARVLGDAARREAVRVAAPPTGDDPRDLIPPTPVPVVP